MNGKQAHSPVLFRPGASIQSEPLNRFARLQKGYRDERSETWNSGHTHHGRRAREPPLEKRKNRRRSIAIEPGAIGSSREQCP
jgi:hypothetical protein